LFKKSLTSIFFFIIFFSNSFSDEKKLIIDKLINTNNITFDFTQITNDKKELGSCVLLFDDKIKCNYKDTAQKEILINGKTLVIRQKTYNKIFFYPLSKSPFINIFNKKNLINLINKSKFTLKKNIELTYIDENEKEILIFFNRIDYDFVGWRVIDQLQNKIDFSIKIRNINSKINPKDFIIPSIN
tara:strand:+ start:715 stop:1272 length:558 start_codon:yes stop_codon:yes gene_type:complete